MIVELIAVGSELLRHGRADTNSDWLTERVQAEQLRQLYGRYGRSFGAAEARQAMRPAGAHWIENPLGSAAGLLIEREKRVLAALPGVPSEMRAMFEADVLPRLQRLTSGRLGRRAVKIAGRTEGSIDRQIHDLYASPGLDVTVLGGDEGVELHALARGRDAADVAEKLQSFEHEVRRRLGEDLFGWDDDRLSAVVGALFLERGRTVATAESCTAGLLGAALTSVPGSTAWYRGGLVVYDDELKRSLAGVRADTLATHGAVSEHVARELAAGASERCGADVGVALTGIAGPGGGSSDKPVGLIHLAIQDGPDSLHWKVRLIGDRETVRARAVVVALDRLRRRLLESA